MDENVDIKLAAKEVASKLKAKAELLESLDEKQLNTLKGQLAKQNTANGGCWLSTPCIAIECVLVSSA
jgi:hypothetical protein